jgi:hypothetical protein
MANLKIILHKNCKYRSLLVSEKWHDDKFMSAVSQQNIARGNCMKGVKEVAFMKKTKRRLAHRFQN